MSVRTRIVVGLLLLSVVLPARAEEKASPEERYKAVVAAFPAPTVRHDFRFASDVFHEGRSVGPFEVAVRAVGAEAKGGEALWQLRFRYNLGKDTHAEEAYVTRTLQPVRGRVAKTTDGEEATWEWEQTGKAIRVVHKSGSTKPMSRSAGVIEPALTTITAILLFARLAPLASEEYATVRLDPTWNLLRGQQPFVSTAIQITLPAEAGKPIQGIAGNGARRMTFALDRRMRLPLWFTWATRTGTALQFGGTQPVDPKGEVTAHDTVFTQAAKTPQAAALRAAYAFATADRHVLDDVMHWPGLRKRMGAKVPARVSPEAFRKGMLGQLIATIREPKKPDAVKPVLLEIADQLKAAEREGGVTRVTFPERFATRWYDVVEVDGVWHLVGWPGN